MKKNTKENFNKTDNKFKTIEEAENYYKKIIFCMPNNVYWLNKDCLTLGCNKNVLDLLKLDNINEFVGITYEEMGQLGGWNEGQALSMKSDDMEVMSTGEAKYNIEEPPLYDKEGNPVYYLSSRVPLIDDFNEVIGVVGISVDITHQKIIENQLAEQILKTQKAYRSKGHFIAQASHEIRNPIGSVSGLLDLIKDRLDKLQVIYFDKCKSLNESDTKSIEEIRTTFNEIFDFYENASDKTEAALTALKNLEKLHLMEVEGVKPKLSLNSIKEIIDEAIYETPYLKKSKNKEIKVNFDKAVPAEIMVDYELIKDALSIVIGNAIRFSPENSQIIVEVKRNDNYLDFIVKDFGVGIAKEQLQDLYRKETENEFTTDQRLRKPSVQLKRAKLMVEACGGELIIDSVLKLGTTVTIRTVFLATEFSNGQSHNLSFEDVLTKMALYKILIIEDDESIQKTTVTQLKELGLKFIDVASSGKEALTKGMESDYDIVFVDFTLPDINGIRITERLLSEKNSDIIFIGLTSHTSEEVETQALKSGVMDVLNKPVNKNDLARVLKAADTIIRNNQK